MPLPAPDVPLVDACSTIFNNTLYTYSATAFQSLHLSEGAKWSNLPVGVAVSGGVCVQATPTDSQSSPALYIVGGTANSSDSTYNGLQRYIFADGSWESISPTTAVTQNRLYHNAVYLNATSSILVYAGSQDGSLEPSSQTFTISTIPPYTVLAYESTAPPAVSPLLMQWSDSKAVMIGGSETNKRVMIFSPSSAWVDSNATLAQNLKDSQAVKAIVLDGDDGSKNMYTFDMTISPNQVNRTILIDADGNPVTNAEPIGSRSVVKTSVDNELVESPATIMKRGNLTLASWPAYNSTLAPTTTRNGYTIAKDQSGLVVISGGNSDDVLCMFKARDNSWVNATSLLVQSQVQNTVSGETSSTVAGLSSTQTPMHSSSASSAASANGSDAPSTSSPVDQKILGAILGSVFGIAILVLLVLLFLRWRRSRKRFIEAGHQRRASGIPAGEKDTMDFADRGLYYASHSKAFHGHGQQESQGSFSSMAILMGKVGQSQKKGILGRRKSVAGSDSSSTFNKNYKTAISKPIPQNNLGPMGRFSTGEKGVSFVQEAPGPSTAPIARPRASGTGRRGSTRRSSGWNRYWSGGSALNILGFGAKRNTSYSSTSDNRASGSQYSDAGLPTTTTQISAMVPPLNLHRPAGRMSRVASNSPTIAHASSNFPLKEGMAGQIERPGSSGSASSYNDYRDTVSSGIPASIHQEHPWTPVGANGWGGGGTVSSAAYSESNYATILPRGRVAEHPPHTTVPNSTPAPAHRPPLQQSSDMSWLNLGAVERRE
jgi:hypothetical protein